MAKLVLSVLLFAVLLVALQDVCFAEKTTAEYKPTANSVLQLRRLLTIDCPSSCGTRCSAAGNQKRCLQFCNLCCKQCQCVPPGTFGNKEACPCYANMKNDKGADKCP